MYGVWPFDVLVSWASDDVSSLAAEVGWSAGPDVYQTIDPRMMQSPRDAVEAHEQAVFWLSIAARRADFNQEKLAQAVLLEAKRQVEARKSTLATNWLCTTTGYGCSGEGARDVLTYALDSVRSSGLNADDTERISGYLLANRWAWDVRRFLPWGAGITIVALGLFAYGRNRQ